MFKSWDNTLNIADIYHNDDIEISEKAKLIAKRLRKLYKSFDDIVDFETEVYDPEIDDIIEDFASYAEEGIDGVEEFDNIMEALYDWSDFHKRLFVKTF